MGDARPLDDHLTIRRSSGHEISDASSHVGAAWRIEVCPIDRDQVLGRRCAREHETITATLALAGREGHEAVASYVDVGVGLTVEGEVETKWDRGRNAIV